MLLRFVECFTGEMMELPVVGSALPRRGNGFTRQLALWAFWLSGWWLEGKLPNLPKFVIVGAPHRSSWEFWLAMMSIYGLGLRVNWMAKHSLFRWPIGGIMRWLGGIAINRLERHGVVTQSVEEFARRPQMILALAPEGTRAKAGCPVAEWKSGYYHIAYGAQVPIVPAYVDNTRKRLIFGEPVAPTGDIDADSQALQAFYDQALVASRQST